MPIVQDGNDYPLTPSGAYHPLGLSTPGPPSGDFAAATSTDFMGYLLTTGSPPEYPSAGFAGGSEGGISQCAYALGGVDYLTGGILGLGRFWLIGGGTLTVETAAHSGNGYNGAPSGNCSPASAISLTAYAPVPSASPTLVASDSGVPGGTLTVTVPNNGLAHYVDLYGPTGSWGFVKAIWQATGDGLTQVRGAAPHLVVEYFTNNSSTFGPQTLDGVVHDALTVGWSWYSRYPANAYFTLRQDSIHNARLLPLLTHIRISYVDPATNYQAVVFTGRLGDPNSTGDDVVWTAWNYLAELSLSRTGYRTLYPVKALGSEIVTPEWTAARTATFALLNFVATGTIQDPLGTDGTTVIKTDTRFGVIDVPRLLLMFDLSEIGRANTINNVTFEITREAPFTFNFWKNKGSLFTGERLTLPGSCVDYQFVPGFSALRNDLATIGTTALGAATEIVKTDEANASVYGRRQDVFTIKTLAGLSGAATEADAQVAITERAVKEATTLQKSISLQLRLGHFRPFDGWDLEDTVRVQVERGRDSIDADYRIVGMRAVQDERGYHPTIMVQLPTVA